MRRQRLTTTVALFAFGCFCASAPGAWASSTLLSGYGGPGQGNQAILGSTLIGGGGASGGSGGSGGGAAGVPAPTSIEAAPGSPPAGKGAGAVPSTKRAHSTTTGG